MTGYAEQRTAALQICAQVASFATEHGAGGAAQAAGDAARRLDAGELWTVCVGEFKRGKSSLINALLDEDPEGSTPIFPVDEDIATNVVTRVSFGETERLRVAVDQDGGVVEREITRAEIADYATEPGNPGNERGVRLLVAEIPHRKLAEGLVLVDTPGVGSLNRQHTATTYGFVAKADAVLFVIDAQETMSTEERDFLRTIREHTAEILFVVTKTDKNADYQRMIDNTRDSAALALARDPSQVTVVGVSSLAKFEYLRGGDEEDLEVSNFAELEDELWTMLRARGGRRQLTRCLGEALRAIDSLLAPMAAEQRALRASGDAELQAAQDEIDARAARLEELRGNQAAWRKALGRQVQDCKSRLRAELKHGRIRVLSAFDRHTRDERMLESPDDIAGAAERDITLLGSALEETLAEEAAEILREIAEETGIVLNPATPDGNLAARIAVERAGFQGEDSDVIGGSALDHVRGATTGMMAGTMVGYVASAVFGLATGGVGFFVPVIVGSAIGTLQASKTRAVRARRERREALSVELRPGINAALTEVESELEVLLTRTERALADAFDDRLAEEGRRVADEGAALSRGRAQSKAQGDARSRELDGRIAALDALGRRARELAAAAPGGPSRVRLDKPPPPDTGDWAD